MVDGDVVTVEDTAVEAVVATEPQRPDPNRVHPDPAPRNKRKESRVWRTVSGLIGDLGWHTVAEMKAVCHDQSNHPLRRAQAWREMPIGGWDGPANTAPKCILLKRLVKTGVNEDAGTIDETDGEDEEEDEGRVWEYRLVGATAEQIARVVSGEIPMPDPRLGVAQSIVRKGVIRNQISDEKCWWFLHMACPELLPAPIEPDPEDDPLLGPP